MQTPMNGLPVNTAAVPTVAEASDDSSWRCARCGRLVDQTKNLWFRPSSDGTRMKVWHARCEGPGVAVDQVAAEVAVKVAS